MSELDDEAKEILLKQMKLLQEESEKVRENGNLLDIPIDLARLSEAMAQIAGVFFRPQNGLTIRESRKR